jgi:hypothetical protein
MLQLIFAVDSSRERDIALLVILRSELRCEISKGADGSAKCVVCWRVARGRERRDGTLVGR